jgi:two-component system sensor histidine kinase RegB
MIATANRWSSGEASEVGRVRVRTLVFTRWVAVAGQTGTLLVVSEGFDFDLPMLPAMAAVGCSAALNVALTLGRGLSRWHSDRQAAGFLAYDILQLAVLLYLTGGLDNPFALLFLVPVTISATILSLTSTVGLGLLAFACVSVLYATHLPLPLPDFDASLPGVYRLAIWLSLVLGMAFLMFYAWRVAEEARRMSDALAATQLALSREQELSVLGGLAAAAAHELGTPLGTVTLVARELRREIGPDSHLRDDIELLNAETDRCRDILARLTRNPREGAERNIAHMSLHALALELADLYGRDDVVPRVTGHPADENAGPAPVVRRSAELVQGLGNLIDNAVDFARQDVAIGVNWDAVEASITITDDGPGFPTEVLAAIGEPYISTRPNRGRMGLGVFISKTLLERTGATLRFANRGRTGGASVVITWPRAIIEIAENRPGAGEGTGDVTA